MDFFQRYHIQHTMSRELEEEYCKVIDGLPEELVYDHAEQFGIGMELLVKKHVSDQTGFAKEFKVLLHTCMVALQLDKADSGRYVKQIVKFNK